MVRSLQNRSFHHIIHTIYLLAYTTMKFATTASLLSLFSLLTSTSAAPTAPNGLAIVQNNCKKPIYLWSVGGSIGPARTIQPGGHWQAPIHRDPVSGGIAIKITRTPNGLYDGSPQMDYAYTLDGTTLWYDLSDVFGDPFNGHPVSVVSANPNCPSICWADGISPAGSQVRDCAAGSDLTLTLCASGC